MAIRRFFRPPQESFFLFGPRGVGKTTWLNKSFPKAVYFDLLSAKVFLQLSRDPGLLEGLIGRKPAGTWVVIDEIQKLTELLDEVHRLMELRKFKFALTGSSARKLKRGGANLLAGRAAARALLPMTSGELGGDFELEFALQWGSLPRVHALKKHKEQIQDFLTAYLHMYLREEIREEGLVRQIEPFVRFLEIAGAINSQVLNIENIAREAGIKRTTADQWFAILEDTLVGYRLKGWRPRIKVRESVHPKFFWFDPGVARSAAGLLYDSVESTWLGSALETLVLHELRAWNEYERKGRDFFYYALPSGQEVDFIVETKKATASKPAEVVCIEVKHSKKWDRSWEKPIRELQESKKINVVKAFGLYRGEDVLEFENFSILPISVFLERLWAGKIF